MNAAPKTNQIIANLGNELFGITVTKQTTDEGGYNRSKLWTEFTANISRPAILAVDKDGVGFRYRKDNKLVEELRSIENAKTDGSAVKVQNFEDKVTDHALAREMFYSHIAGLDGILSFNARADDVELGGSSFSYISTYMAHLIDFFRYTGALYVDENLKLKISDKAEELMTDEVAVLIEDCFPLDKWNILIHNVMATFVTNPVLYCCSIAYFFHYLEYHCRNNIGYNEAMSPLSAMCLFIASGEHKYILPVGKEELVISEEKMEKYIEGLFTNPYYSKYVDETTDKPKVVWSLRLAGAAQSVKLSKRVTIKPKRTMMDNAINFTAAAALYDD